jgi:hypothetical protein
VCKNEYTKEEATTPPAKDGPAQYGKISVLVIVSYTAIVATVIATPLNPYDMRLNPLVPINLENAERSNALFKAS